MLKNIAWFRKHASFLHVNCISSWRGVGGVPRDNFVCQKGSDAYLRKKKIMYEINKFESGKGGDMLLGLCMYMYVKKNLIIYFI